MKFQKIYENFHKVLKEHQIFQELFFEISGPNGSLKDLIRKVHSGEKVVVDGMTFKPSDDGIIGVVPKKRSSIEVEPHGNRLKLSIHSPEYDDSFVGNLDVSDLQQAIKRVKVFLRHEDFLSKMTAELTDEQYKQLFPDSIGRSMNLFGQNVEFLKLIQQVLPHRLPKGIGGRVGSGGEGEAFEYGPDKIFKVFIVDSLNTAKIHLRTLERVKKRNIPCIVQVFDYGFIGRLIPPYKGIGRRESVRKDAIYVFYYITERLQEFQPSREQVEQVFDCLHSNRVEFDDVADNLMIDKEGQPKLIDIGRFIKVNKE